MDPKLQEYASYVRTGVKRMEVLIHDLLTYSRLTHAEDDFTPRRANLEAVLCQALNTVEARVRENHAEVTSDPLPSVVGDEGHLAHVFQNLLSNALKYRKREVAPRIHVGVEKRDSQWVISVRDNGIGFDQDQAERIFGLFKRLHRDEEYPGTGMGLAICKQIVERYRGRIWAESQPGAGSTFFVSLPAAPK
jgi:light-regulated signal transduction histidine kinase (bacteriophytochrome)